MTEDPSTVMNTHQRIMSAAIDLFATRGFAGTGIRELADSVGMSTSSLYHHVRSKDDLLDTIVSTTMRAMNEMADRWVEAVELAPLERLSGLIACHVVAHATAPQEAIVVDRQLSAMRPESRAAAVADRDGYQQAWRNLIEACQDTGVIRVSDPALATQALLGATTAVADWYRTDGRLDALDVAATFTRLCLDLLNANQHPDVPDLNAALTAFDHRWEDR